jgi:hypothetical protein
VMLSVNIGKGVVTGNTRSWRSVMLTVALVFVSMCKYVRYCDVGACICSLCMFVQVFVGIISML